MNKLTLSILFVVISTTSNIAQENLFGINWNKYFNCNDTISYRKVACLPNKYFTYAEVFNKTNCIEQYIVFKNSFSSVSQDNNLIKELSDQISKSYADATYYCLNKTVKDKIVNEYYWVMKKQEKHIVLKLFLDNDLGILNFKIICFKNSKLFFEGMHNLMYNENKEIGIVNKKDK